MSLTLVENSANIPKFETKNIRETIAMLEELLARAKSDEITGIAGIYTTTKDERGIFYGGECCKRVDQTIGDLYALQSEIQYK